MKTEVERLEEKDTVLLRVEVPADEFGKAVNDAYNNIAKKFVVPGFRKGKVPKAVIDSRFGKESVQQEALERELPHYYAEAVRETEIEPVDQPDVDVVQIGADQPLIFTAKVRVKPEVKLGEYKGIKVEKQSVEPTEEEIDEQIEALRNNFASLEPIEGSPVKQGDFALINFEGFINDVPFEGGSANDYLLEVGSGTFIPGFEDQVIGMKKGDIKDIIVTFPGDYGNEELAGKEARFRVLVKEIKEKKLPALDDDFAKQVGFDTLDELRADVSNKITDVKKKYVNSQLRNEIVEKVTDEAEVDVHDSMIENELDEMVEEFTSDVRKQGLELDKYLELTGMTLEKIREDWKDRARDRVKSRLVLETIAKDENIEVTPEEVDNEIRKASEATGREFEEVKQIFLMKGTMGDLRHRILIGKTVDWLADNAVIEEPKEQAEVKAKPEEKEDLAQEEVKEEEKIQNDKGTE